MLAKDVVAFARTLLAEPYTTRWSDSDMLLFVSQAQRDAARETRAVEGRRVIQTIPGKQEYQLPDMVSLIRVYMAGPGFVQRLPVTSVPKMEGDQIRYYDNSAPQYTPQWLTFPAAPYPVASCLAGIGYTGLPMFPGTRPEYYLRGIGLIGLVPAPLFAYALVLDLYEMPEEVTTLNATMMFNQDWKKYMAWATCEFAYFSDQALDMVAEARTGRKEAMEERQSFVTNFNEDDPQGPQILTHRSFFAAQHGTGGRYG